MAHNECNTDLSERGSILILIKKNVSDDNVTTFLKHCNKKDIDDDDTVHLYQCRESCTDENYRSPELSLAQIKNLQLRMMTFKRNGYYYTVSADMIDMYGKGLTPETSSEDLLCLITDNLRCGKGGIYPSLSSDKFNHIFCKNWFANFIDNNDDNHSKKMIKRNGRQIEFTLEDKSVRSFGKAIKKLIAFNDKSCTFASYNEWITNGCPVLNDGNHYFLEFRDGKICWDETNLNDEGIRIIYLHTSKEHLLISTGRRTELQIAQPLFALGRCLVIKVSNVILSIWQFAVFCFPTSQNLFLKYLYKFFCNLP